MNVFCVNLSGSVMEASTTTYLDRERVEASTRERIYKAVSYNDRDRRIPADATAPVAVGGCVSVARPERAEDIQPSHVIDRIDSF